MNDINKSMIERLEAEPDAAVLFTIQDLDGDSEQQGSLSLYAEHPEREELARRLLALRAGRMVGKYFPNEIGAAGAQSVGGSVSYRGVYRDPEIDWGKYHDEDDEDPPVLSEVGDGE